LDLPDFYFTGDDYRYHFETQAKHRFLDLLRERFNVGVRYNGRILKWDTVIEYKATELGRYLAGRSSKLDFSEPCLKLACIDNKDLRRTILCLSQSTASRLGIGKSTLHYLRKNARSTNSFRVYGRIADRLAPLM
jgi:CRISPR-associated protein Cas1